VNEHVRLLSEAGFIDTHQIPDTDHKIFHYVPIRLTNAGHDFLSAIRDATIWEKTKTAAKAVGGGTLSVLLDCAVAYAKSKLKEKFDLVI
jgi:hypothetical protein